jgi:hypothetical protein
MAALWLQEQLACQQLLLAAAHAHWQLLRAARGLRMVTRPDG